MMLFMRFPWGNTWCYWNIPNCNKDRALDGLLKNRTVGESPHIPQTEPNPLCDITLVYYAHTTDCADNCSLAWELYIILTRIAAHRTANTHAAHILTDCINVMYLFTQCSTHVLRSEHHLHTGVQLLEFMRKCERNTFERNTKNDGICLSVCGTPRKLRFASRLCFVCTTKHNQLFGIQHNYIDRR